MSSVSSKMKLLVICDGYEMRHDKANSCQTIQYWLCLKVFCGGRAKSAFGATINLQGTKPHNCRRSASNIQRRCQIETLKKDAVSSFSKPSIDVISTAKDGISDVELLCLPNDRALQRMIQHVRQPIGASSVDKPPLEIVWLDFFTQTKQGTQFLLVDSRQAEPNKLPFFIFLSQSGMNLLNTNANWSIDGTFFCAPQNFYQLYTINAFWGQSTLPAAYCLLPNKNTDTYRRMFTALRDCGLQRPASVMADFEIALIKAISEIYGNMDLSKCCLFHLAKNAFANVQSKGLMLAYQDEEAKVLFRSLASLAFLPENEVADGFDDLATELSSLAVFDELGLIDQLTEYLGYFERTYIRHRIGRISRDGLFPIAHWNCRDAAIEGLPRTNNAIEGWHNSFNRRFPKAHMLLSQFIVRLQSEEEKTRQIILRARVNPAEALRQVRRPSEIQREENIKLLVLGYCSENRLQFLQSIQHHLARFTIPSNLGTEEVNSQHEDENLSDNEN